MSLELFLNELSSPNKALPYEVATNYLKAIVATTRAAFRIDPGLTLNSETPVHSLSLGTACSIASIRNRGECVEESLFLKALQNRAPLRQALAILKHIDGSEFEYRLLADAPVRAAEPAEALGLAHLFDGLTISFPSHVFWHKISISLRRLQLDANGNLEISSVEARNACSPDHINEHEVALRSVGKPTFQNGRELWASRSELLPNLRFIPRTRPQIEGILEGDPALLSIWTKLAGIDQAIALWSQEKSDHPIFPFNVRPESRSRLHLVSFNDENGSPRTFSDHVDFAPGEGRIHFIIEPNPRRHAIVGHLGRKLGIG
ncbi:hypothetical protein [Beijerinckia indica]|uniref:Uncharacterized protein n=1 Tax=Beijerinckia indica subsp. indica (strain ATCC 9039 / DSM 1715 / NCIMB 8712) TaxID=395963 RepID=B2IGZ9_BEII9|nr:hypothetical protein [Beijerinckia indica]ACB94413.1 hypothetical protein Bind_0763 [Beijerinckia indica subsp. indica ATCC 9039]